MLFVNGKQIRGVIFDIDGTLIDSFSAFTSVFNKGISQFDLRPVSQQFLVQSLRKGANLADLLRMIFPLQTDESLIERCKGEILQHFQKIEASEVKPFPGINELFWNLMNKGIKIGIATGRTSMPEHEWDRFKRFGLERLIDSIVTSREVASRKPAPDAIVECAKRMKVPIERCLIVGDTEDDIIAARKAGGIPVAILAREDHLDISESEQPEFIFENLIEFTLFLENKKGRGEIRFERVEGGKDMGLNRDLFNFSAKVACLEGYLYERKDADVSTLPNWVGNIDNMYRNLPAEIKGDFLEDYKNILEKILQSSEKILKKEDSVLTKLRSMLADISGNPL